MQKTDCFAVSPPPAAVEGMFLPCIPHLNPSFRPWPSFHSEEYASSRESSARWPDNMNIPSARWRVSGGPREASRARAIYTSWHGL